MSSLSSSVWRWGLARFLDFTADLNVRFEVPCGKDADRETIRLDLLFWKDPSAERWSVQRRPRGARRRHGERLGLDARPQSIAACTLFEIRSSRALCHGSGTRLLVKYAKLTPESGSPQQYDEPTPPWPNVRGEARLPRPRMVSVVPRRCGPSPRCIGMPMYSSRRSPVWLRIAYCSMRGETSCTP